MEDLVGRENKSKELISAHGMSLFSISLFKRDVKHAMFNTQNVATIWFGLGACYNRKRARY
jgi:hypothetical protein